MWPDPFYRLNDQYPHTKDQAGCLFSLSEKRGLCSSHGRPRPITRCHTNHPYSMIGLFSLVTQNTFVLSWCISLVFYECGMTSDVSSPLPATIALLVRPVILTYLANTQPWMLIYICIRGYFLTHRCGCPYPW